MILQAIGIALESRRLDVIEHIYKHTNDVSLLSYAMEAALDTGFSLSYRDQVLRFLFPLFPQSSTDGSHVHTLTRLLITLGDSGLTIPLFKSMVPSNKLMAYQLAFDLVEGGARDYLDSVRSDLPEGQSVRCQSCLVNLTANNKCRNRRRFLTRYEVY